MSISAKLFLAAYQNLGLDSEPYYIYGSGKCCDDIYSFILAQGLRAPEAVLDTEVKSKELYAVNDIATWDRDALRDHYIICASLAFFDAISTRLVNAYKIPVHNIKSLHSESLASKAWDEHCNLATATFTVNNSADAGSASYVKNGYYVGCISNQLVIDLQQTLSRSDYKPLERDQYETHYVYSNSLSDQQLTEINQQQEFAQLNQENLTKIQQLADILYEEVRDEIQSDWRVINVRAWQSKESSNGVFASNQLHTDGFHQSIKKILVYLSAPSKSTGTTELVLSNGDSFVLEGEAGTWLLFDNSRLLHKGIYNPAYIRNVVELTIAPSTYKTQGVSVGGNNAWYPELPWYRAVSSVNLGGGKAFKSPGWVNYDVIKHPNVTQLTFDESTQLPHKDKSISLVYSSHFFEHISSSTLRPLLQETHRILVEHGDLVIKLPDFENVIAQYKAGNSDYFELWNISDETLQLWKNFDVKDCIENRASMIFLGYWNRHYGDHFSNQRSFSREAYHGPARIEKKQIKKLLTQESPNKISEYLKHHVLKNESSENISFNHQNAWSKTELIQMMNRLGFSVTSTDKNVIQNHFPDIPDLLEASEISMYLSFKKTPNTLLGS